MDFLKAQLASEQTLKAEVEAALGMKNINARQRDLVGVVHHPDEDLGKAREGIKHSPRKVRVTRFFPLPPRSNH